MPDWSMVTLEHVQRACELYDTGAAQPRRPAQTTSLLLNGKDLPRKVHQNVSVFKIDPGAGERLGILATASVGDGSWVDLREPIIVRVGEGFIAVPEPAPR